jgi:hypothetical protein
MTCYYQGCTAQGTTKEHVPPKCFFPEGEKLQLITVASCPVHNSAKSQDDTYALAHICLSSSPSNRSREVWETTIAPQLGHNNSAFAKTLLHGSRQVEGGVQYSVDVQRLDGFFTALSCGLIYKSRGSALPTQYKTLHIYHNFVIEDDIERTIADAIQEFYAQPPVEIYEFGTPDLRNARIYTAQIIGIPGAWGNISIVHTFYGTFKVTTMLTVTDLGSR